MLDRAIISNTRATCKRRYATLSYVVLILVVQCGTRCTDPIEEQL